MSHLVYVNLMDAMCLIITVHWHTHLKVFSAADTVRTWLMHVSSLALSYMKPGGHGP